MTYIIYNIVCYIIYDLTYYGRGLMIAILTFASNKQGAFRLITRMYFSVSCAGMCIPDTCNICVHWIQMQQQPMATLDTRMMDQQPLAPSC
jgi:hypothetical protein